MRNHSGNRFLGLLLLYFCASTEQQEATQTNPRETWCQLKAVGSWYLSESKGSGYAFLPAKSVLTFTLANPIRIGKQERKRTSNCQMWILWGCLKSIPRTCQWSPVSTSHRQVAVGSLDGLHGLDRTWTWTRSTPAFKWTSTVEVMQLSWARRAHAPSGLVGRSGRRA